jgi:tRNA(Arg) A34 adenosine deaminase TadA
MSQAQRFLCEAIELAQANMEQGGRPFGAVVVRDGEVVATGVNEIIATNDPTAHAEMTALRAASRKLGSPSLAGCAVYASGHPCPMCMAAMRLSGVSEVYYAYSNDDGAPFGLSTAAIYADLAKPFAEQSMKIAYLPVRLETGSDLYAEWKRRQSKPA